MSKDDKYRGAYDPVAALRNAPKLLGMELQEHGPAQLQGGYYINGEPHPYRKDKLKVFVSRGSVWVLEEGDRCLSLPQWLIEYGGAADFKDALRMIKGESQVIRWNKDVVASRSPLTQYVSPDVLTGSKQFDLRKCNLFNWMCTMFPEEKVREVWDLYNVTTDSNGCAVFWYVNQDGKILFDKRIAYKSDGHRDKLISPGRQFRVGEGYNGRCYFGACIPSDGRKVFVCESEKSCLLGHLYWGRRFVATGGKNNLRGIEPEMLLCPDMDAIEEWSNNGPIFEWWKKWEIDKIPPTADIGDMVEWKMKNR